MPAPTMAGPDHKPVQRALGMPEISRVRRRKARLGASASGRRRQDDHQRVGDRRSIKAAGDQGSTCR